MATTFEITEPFNSGRLAVGDGHVLHWTESGNPDGKPAVLVHGGPGSGSWDGNRRLFDPRRYRIIQFDQRNCGLSTPYAGEATVDLATNTTTHLIADIERLRVELGVDRWLVWGASWGSVLGLAYAEAHPEVVTELILAAVGSGRSDDVEWITRTVGRIFPREWREFRDHLQPERRNGNLAAAYNELLIDPDPSVHEPAALAWCRWEDAHMSLTVAGNQHRLQDEEPAFQLCFSRLVTHYWGNNVFLDDDHLLGDTHRLGGIPTFIGHGRFDVSSPMDYALDLAEAIPGAELFIAEDSGHGGTDLWDWIASVTDRLAPPLPTR